MRFKENKLKFSGYIWQFWQEYVHEYRQMSRDYNLAAVQNLQFLHNL